MGELELGIGNQLGACRLTSAEALSLRLSKLNSESPDEVLVSLLQRGKSFESESEIAGSVQTSLFSTVHDALAYAVCVVAVVASRRTKVSASVCVRWMMAEIGSVFLASLLQTSKMPTRKTKTKNKTTETNKNVNLLRRRVR